MNSSQAMLTCSRLDTKAEIRLLGHPQASSEDGRKMIDIHMLGDNRCILGRDPLSTTANYIRDLEQGVMLTGTLADPVARIMHPGPGSGFEGASSRSTRQSIR